jgi:predicted nucleic-acid-binding Zn-ribbon protein
MRKSGICPKCSSNQMLHVGAVADTGESHVIVRPMNLAMLFTGTGFFGDEKNSSAGRLTAVVCKGCGFAELYVLDPDNIKPDGKYVTDISGPTSSSPHR